MAELATDARQVGRQRAVDAQRALDGVDVLGQRGLLELQVGVAAVGGVDDLLNLGARPDVVAAVHEQQVLGRRQRRQLFEVLRDAVLDEARRVGREGHAVAVAKRQVDGEHLAAVGGLPDKLGVRRLDAAEDDAVINIEAAQNLGNLGRVAECVRQVAGGHHLTHRLGLQATDEQVADEGLGRDEELVGQDVPRAHLDAAAAQVARQPLALVGPHFQVVVEDDRLAVEVEILIGRFGVKDIEQAVDGLDELEAETLEGQVPLAVPVGVRDDPALVSGARRRAGGCHCHETCYLVWN